MRPFVIAGRHIGPGEPCFLIAEAGVNHDGDAARAHALVDASAQAGADAVKFQTFLPEALAAASAPVAAYAAGLAADQRALLERLTLPDDVWPELMEHAAERGLVFLSTPFDAASADLLCRLGVPALKVPSGELTNLPFVRDLAGRGKPMLVSTGMGDEAEVRAAFEAAAAAPGVCLMHCVSAYPSPAEESNLRAIRAMSMTFDVPVGWSDHTADADTAVAAVALGASVLEKHLTTDRTLPGPDHAASLDPDGFASYVRRARRIEAALGDGVKRPSPSESSNITAVRRSWHATRELRPGQVLSPADVVALRPASGLPPSVRLDGRRMRRAVAAGAVILEEDLA